MRSGWVTALAIVGGLVAQPTDAWAGKLADKGGFRQFKLGLEVTPYWFKAQGCSAASTALPEITKMYTCAASNIGDLAVERVEVSVFEKQIYLVRIMFDQSETANGYFRELEKILVEAYGSPETCQEVQAVRKSPVDCELFSQEGLTQDEGGRLPSRTWERLWQDGPYRVTLQFGDDKRHPKHLNFRSTSALLLQRMQEAREQDLERRRQLEKQEIKKAAEGL